MIFVTAEQFEAEYQDALDECRTQGKDVGEPYRTRDGVRAVHVNNFPCPDRLVFGEAYGERLADQIMSEREETDPSPR